MHQEVIMFCPNCGSQVNDGEKFCGSCGFSFPNNSAQPAQAAPQQQYFQAQPQGQPFQQNAQSAASSVKPKLGGFLAKVKPIVTDRRFIIGAAGVVVVAAAAIIIANVAGSAVGAGSFNITTNGYYTTSVDGTLYVFKNGTRINQEFDDYYDYSFNSEGGYVVADGELYAISGTSVKKLTDDFDSVTNMTETGNAFVYVSDGTAYLYNGSSKEIGDWEDIENIRVSPNGSCAAFTMDGEVMLFKGSKPESICEDGRPLMVADDGTTYINYNGEFVVSNGGKKVSFDDDGTKTYDISDIISISTDNKSMLYSDGGTTRLFEASMSKPIKVAGSYVSVLLPKNCYSMQSFDSFVGSVNGGEYRRYIRRGDKFENFKIANDAYDVALSQDGSRLAFLKDSKLYTVSTTAQGDEKKLAAKKVSGYYPSSDFSMFYYQEYDDEYTLCVSTGDAESTKKIVSLDDINSLIPLSNGNMVISDYDGSVTVSINGGKPADSKIEADNSLDCDYSKTAVYCWSDDELYVSTDGKSFTTTKIER